MLGGTGISAATTLNLLADDGYVLSECCKLLTFSKVVLIDKFMDYAAVAEIQNKIGNRLDDIQIQLEELSDKEDAKSDDKAELKERKVKIKVAKKSIKYLRNTSDALQKLVKKNPSFKPERLLPQKPKSKQ